MTSDLLFATHRDGVFRYLCRIVGQGEAPDLTQEVFLRVARSRLPSDGPEAQRAWLFRIARNLALNHQRDARRRPATETFADAARAAPQDTAAAMHEALDRLAPLDRDVFLLKEVAGLTYAEIALSCDITGDAVRSRLHRARQQLRASLAPLSGAGRISTVKLYDR